MTNDSSTGGYLASVGTAPLNDDALIDVFSSIIGGTTGIAGNLIRPRWQPSPPNQPTIATDWMALGITVTDGDFYPSIGHLPNGNGVDYLSRQERLIILCSVYGPNAGKNATLVRDGLSIAQNRETLQLAGLGLIGIDRITTTTEQFNNQYYRRLDLPIRVQRVVVRVYPVRNVLHSAGTIQPDNVHVTTNYSV